MSVDAGIDGGDAFTVAPDGNLIDDRPMLADVGLDLIEDTGPVDGDGDGVPAAMDCDDTDPLVGTSSVRACTGTCAAGTETCTGGVWSACDAPTDCACTTPGMTRSTGCGMCGLASQTCGSDHVWGAPGACMAEGECFDGATQTDTSMCGMRTRICDSTCHWSVWTVTTPAGECEAGTSAPATGCPLGETGSHLCDATCHWGSDVCASSCARPAMPSASGADPVCIPAATFYLGDAANGWESPVITVTLTADFYIDRYPVTKGRFEACVIAGTCTRPSDATYAALASDQFPTATFAQASAFCAWDGGALPSEFQWELAARGPLPDMRIRPWGTTDASAPCQYHATYSCPNLPTRTSEFPMDVSPYGVRLMGNIEVWSGTRYRYDYSALPMTVTDPTVTDLPGSDHTRRGAEYCSSPSGFVVCSDESTDSVSARGNVPSTVTIRCVY